MTVILAHLHSVNEPLQLVALLWPKANTELDVPMGILINRFICHSFSCTIHFPPKILMDGYVACIK